MLIISVLSEKCNGILCVIRITSWHVHIINKVKHLEFTNWGECLTSFLLKALLKDHLKQVCISVEVEVDYLVNKLFTSSGQLSQKTFDDLCFTAASHTYKLWAVIDLDELLH